METKYRLIVRSFWNWFITPKMPWFMQLAQRLVVNKECKVPDTRCVIKKSSQISLQSLRLLKCVGHNWVGTSSTLHLRKERISLTESCASCYINHATINNTWNVIFPISKQSWKDMTVITQLYCQLYITWNKVKCQLDAAR